MGMDSYISKNTLQEKIIQRVESAGGAISFAEYMDLCLYEPNYGYYTSERTKLGKEGDFYTSAFVGGFMGMCIARKLADAARKLELEDQPLTVIEWGGGDGRLAEAILNELEASFPELYERLRWISAESSPYHRSAQEARLASHAPRVAGIVPPDAGLVDESLRTGSSMIVANELLDAFPVHRLRYGGDGWEELYVTWNKATGAFEERTGPISREDMLPLISGLRGRRGQTIEVGCAALDWIRSIGERMYSGVMLLVDYGDVTAELTAPHRMNGTLITYQRHQASDQVYLDPGERDITSHVNFEWVMQAAVASGFRELRLCTQKQFLVEQGILEQLREHDGSDPFSETARRNRSIRQLLLSDGMSELFKVLEMYKRE